MKANQYLIDFYNHYDENSRLEQKHGTVEFLTTMRYIQKFLKPGDRVLEIGAGTGRYSHALARQGYAVDAIELVEHNIEVFQRNTLPGETISVMQGNALDLSAFPDDQYDITLLLGPLYHLYTKEDIDDLMSIFPTTRLHYIAADGCSLFMREAVDAMDNETFRLYLRYHFAVCEREDLSGITSHAVDIFKK